MAPAPDERDNIRSAIERILAGEPIRSNGALTIVALAQEADVPRSALTQRHPDLRNEFYNRTKECVGTSAVEFQLRATIAKLKKAVQDKNAELAQMHADIPALVRALNQMTLENHQLREALSNHPGVVIPLSQEPSTRSPKYRPRAANATTSLVEDEHRSTARRMRQLDRANDSEIHCLSRPVHLV